MKTTTQELPKGMKMYHFSIPIGGISKKILYWVIAFSKQIIIDYYYDNGGFYYGNRGVRNLKKSDISVCKEIPVSEFDEFPVVFYDVSEKRFYGELWGNLKKDKTRNWLPTAPTEEGEPQL